MFWHNNYAPSVQIDAILNEEDVTLSKLMDAEDILQECKSQNKKLIEFLTKDDILNELVNLVTEEPSNDLEERARYKYSNIACEILTCDIPILTEKLAGNDLLLSKLYAFINKEEPLNPLLASFFSKTIHALLRRASDQNWFSYQFVCLQVIESLKNHSNCIELLLRHIQTSAIMDLILILLTKIEGDEMRQNVLSWLDDQHLIQRLIKLLSPYSDPRKHTNVSQLLCDIIKCPRLECEKRPDTILQSLQSEDTIKLILDTILSGKKIESSIVGGIRILITLLGQRDSENVEASEGYGISLNNIVDNVHREKYALVIKSYIFQMNQLLLDPPDKPTVKTTAGILEKPFGRSRLYILKLYVSLISTSNSEVIEEFIMLDTFNILFDLFFDFAWNSFLHTQVKICISLVINMDLQDKTEILFNCIFIKSYIIKRILCIWRRIKNNGINNSNHLKQGYLGHLIMIANEIVLRSSENNELSNYLKSNLTDGLLQEWENFIESDLHDVNKKQNITLGEHPDSYSQALPWFGELSRNTQDNSTISNSNCYIKFNEESDALHFGNSNDYSNHQSFAYLTDDIEKSQEMFSKLCEEKSFENPTNTNQWRHEFTANNSNWFSSKSRNSSSSEEEIDDDSQVVCSKADSKDPWDSVHANKCDKVDTSIDMWHPEITVPFELTGWANFENFSDSLVTSHVNMDKLQQKLPDKLPELSQSNDDVSLNYKVDSDSLENIQKDVSDDSDKTLDVD